MSSGKMGRFVVAGCVAVVAVTAAIGTTSNVLAIRRLLRVNNTINTLSGRAVDISVEPLFGRFQPAVNSSGMAPHDLRLLVFVKAGVQGRATAEDWRASVASVRPAAMISLTTIVVQEVDEPTSTAVGDAVSLDAAEASQLFGTWALPICVVADRESVRLVAYGASNRKAIETLVMSLSQVGSRLAYLSQNRVAAR